MNAPATLPATLALPTLADGEKYAGLVHEDGAWKHLILLAGNLDAATWDKAMAWAGEQGGALPTRFEQAILYGNLRDEFKRDWYWSGTQFAGGDAWAWSQTFVNGYQYYDDKADKLRARAVRRVAIQ
jgi:hypothetical protein